MCLEEKNNNIICLTSGDLLLACWTVQKGEEQGRKTEARWQSHSWDGSEPGKKDYYLERKLGFQQICWHWGWFSKKGQLQVDSWFLNLCNISFLLPPVSLGSLAHILTSKMWRECGRICSHGHEIEFFYGCHYIPIHLDQPHWWGQCSCSAQWLRRCLHLFQITFYKGNRFRSEITHVGHVGTLFQITFHKGDNI